MSKFIGMILGYLLGLALFWWLWCYLLPLLWATGPAVLVAPSYWQFVGFYVLARFVGKTLFGRSK